MAILGAAVNSGWTINPVGANDNNVNSPYWVHSSFRIYGDYPEFDFEARSEFWLSMYYSGDGTAFHWGSGRELMIFKDGETGLVRIITGVDDSLILQIWDGTVWVDLDETETAMHSNADWTTTSSRLQIHVKMHATEGIISVKKGDNILLSYAGDTLRTVATTCDHFAFKNVASGWVFSHYACFVADENTEDIVMVAPINQNTGLDEWVPSVVNTNWNNATKRGNSGSILDNTFNITELENVTNTLTTTNTVGSNFAYGFDVVGVMALARARATTGGSGAVRPVVRCGGAVAEGDRLVLTEAFQSVKHMFTINPATGLPFLVSDLSTLQTGVKTEAA